MSIDLIKVLKFESDEGDFGATEIDNLEDYLDALGFAIAGDENIRIDKDGSGNMQFRDSISGGPHTLADLLESASGGITESQHRALDTLTHLIAESNHEDWTWDGWKVTDVINWTDDNKTTKIRECNITYNGWKVNTIELKQYDTGVLSETLTGTLTWSGWKLDYIGWVLS